MVLALPGNRVRQSLRMFLVALAIVDGLNTVIVNL
ncbi:Na+/H+ antiporter NhaA [Neptunomonas sp.]